MSNERKMSNAEGRKLMSVKEVQEADVKSCSYDQVPENLPHKYKFRDGARNSERGLAISQAVSFSRKL